MNKHPFTLPDDLARLAETICSSTAAEPRIQVANPRVAARAAMQDGIDLLSNMKTYFDATTPIANLPDQLFSEIFLFCLDTEYAYSSARCMFMLVCRH